MAEKIIGIIDDDVKLLSRLGEYLAGFGYQVNSWSDPFTGLDALKKEAPNLLILDIMLPGIDGFETLRRLRAFSSIPVIMLTDKSQDYNRKYSTELGAEECIIKPFSTQELIDAVNQFLKSN